MKRINSGISKFEITEPDTERKIKKVNLEIEKCEYIRAPKITSKNSIRALGRDSQERKHKKAISSIDLLSINGVIKKKLTFNSTKNSNPNLELKETHKALIQPTTLNFPEKLQLVQISDEAKMIKLKEKFSDFKKTIHNLSRRTKTYDKNLQKVNSFLFTQRGKMFSKAIMRRVIFNAWRELVKLRKFQRKI
jgi:hypothetical protein